MTEQFYYARLAAMVQLANITKSYTVRLWAEKQGSYYLTTIVEIYGQ